jgi:cytochrome c oxidase subunit II
VKLTRRLPFALALLALALVASACAQDAPLDSLNPAGPIAREIDNLWQIVFWAAVAVFVVVEGAIVYAIFRFRKRRKDESLPTQTHGNTRLEVAWTIAPAVVLAILAVPTVATIFSLDRERPGSLPIKVTAHQWWWEYEYPGEDVVTANELHIPIGQPIRLALTSGDVIHSFWVPRLGGKQDTVPEQTNYLTIQADEPGEYAGTCAEYCGLSHANMRLKVFAHTPEGFQQWLEDQRADAVAPQTEAQQRGHDIFMTEQCVACHTIRGTEAVATEGPDLTHFGSRTTLAGAIFDNTEEELRAWLIDSPGVKPGSKMPAGIAEMELTAEQIEDLIAYLMSLE